MAIYLTGDCHGRYNRFAKERFPEREGLCKDDFVIVLGDMGLIWSTDPEDMTEKANIQYLDSLPFTVLFIDGNHENFDRLNAMPIDKWHGGKVHRIGESIYHLMRGQVFELEGHKFFTFGGAQSHDIDGGILDPADPDFEKKHYTLYHYSKKPFRILHESWWPEELPSQEEMQEGWDNLVKHNFKVRGILTHCTSSSCQAVLSAGMFKPDILTDYLEQVKQRVLFKRWYFGHYHLDKRITHEESLLYNSIVRII